MPSDVDYTSVASVKQTLGLDGSGADSFISELIPQVSRAIDTYVFGATDIGFQTTGNSVADFTEYHDGGLESVILHRLISDAQAQRDAVVVLEDGVTLDINTDFQMDLFPARTLYRTDKLDSFSRSFAAGRRNIKVTYIPAYLLVPPDVAAVADEETARRYLVANTDSGDGGSLTVTQRTPEFGGSVIYKDDDFSLNSKRVLDGYRDLSFF